MTLLEAIAEAVRALQKVVGDEAGWKAAVLSTPEGEFRLIIIGPAAEVGRLAAIEEMHRTAGEA